MTDIEAIRARFQPLTRGGHEYEIFAERGGVLYGRILLFPAHQDLWESASWSPGGYSRKTYGAAYDLIPRSPHEELLAEARRFGPTPMADTVAGLEASIVYASGLIDLLIEALEGKWPVQHFAVDDREIIRGY